MKYQTMRIDHLNHLYIEASAGEVRFTVNGDALVVEPVLSEKKPRTKVEYVEVTESIFDLRHDFESGDLYFNSTNLGWTVVTGEYDLMNKHKDGELYRRIETPMTEREAFVDSVSELCDEMDINMGKIDWIAKTLFDSGKFKLVS